MVAKCCTKRMPESHRIMGWLPPPDAPWCWNIYPHLTQNWPSHVDKSSSTMEHLGPFSTDDLDLPSTVKVPEPTPRNVGWSAVDIDLGFPPHSWMLYMGKSYTKMDDEQGYPHLWKPQFMYFQNETDFSYIYINNPYKNIFKYNNVGLLVSYLLTLSPNFCKDENQRF